MADREALMADREALGKRIHLLEGCVSTKWWSWKWTPSHDHRPPPYSLPSTCSPEKSTTRIIPTHPKQREESRRRRSTGRRHFIERWDLIAWVGGNFTVGCWHVTNITTASSFLRIGKNKKLCPRVLAFWGFYKYVYFVLFQGGVHSREEIISTVNKRGLTKYKMDGQ